MAVTRPDMFVNIGKRFPNKWVGADFGVDNAGFPSPKKRTDIIIRL